jgi:hypothetical protein
MRSGASIPEFSLYRNFSCPAHTNFLCPVYPGLTVNYSIGSQPHGKASSLTLEILGDSMWVSRGGPGRALVSTTHLNVFDEVPTRACPLLTHIQYLSHISPYTKAGIK